MGFTRTANFVAGAFLLVYVALLWGTLAPTSLYIKAMGLLPLAGWAFFNTRRNGFSSRLYAPQSLIPFGFVIYLAGLLYVTPLAIYSLEGVLVSLLLFFVFLLVALSLVNANAFVGWENALLFTITFFALVELIPVLLFYARWLEISGSIFSVSPIGMRLPGVLLGGPNHVAAFVNLIIPLALVRGLRASGSWQKGGWIALGIFFLSVAYYTSSRAGWISGIAAIGVTLFLYFIPQLRQIATKPKRILTVIQKPKTKYLILLGAVASVLLVVLFTRQAQNTPGHRGLLSGRQDIWAGAVDIWGRSPVVGNGVDSFPVFYAQKIGAPPGWLPPQAHNLWLQLGAETGAVGLALTAAFVVMAVRVFLRAWRSNATNLTQRARLASYAGASAAILAHGFADYLFRNPLYSVCALILLSLIFGHESVSRRAGKSNVIPLVLLLVGVVLFLSGASYVEKGRSEFQQGLQLWAGGDLHSGSEKICLASELAQTQSFYDFQCGLSEAYLAYMQRDPSNVDIAVEVAQNGLRHDPYWPLHWANLGAMQLQLGDSQAAVRSFETAMDAAPRNALFALNLGVLFDEMGKAESSHQNLVSALESDPWISISPYFSDSPILQNAWEDIDLSKLDAIELNKLEAYQALAEGDLDLAEDHLVTAQAASRADAEFYALWAMLLEGQGEFERAWISARTAVFLDGESPRVLAWAALVAENLGKLNDARIWRERAFTAWALSPTFSRDYYITVYHRSFLPFDLIPGFLRPDCTKEMRDGFIWLANYYENQGLDSNSEEIVFWLQSSGLE